MQGARLIQAQIARVSARWTDGLCTTRRRSSYDRALSALDPWNREWRSVMWRRGVADHWRRKAGAVLPISVEYGE